MYPFAYSSSSSSSPPHHSVDCTLSLATPSTRLTQDDDHHRHCFTTWDFFQSETAAPYQLPSDANVQVDNHPIRRCANCNTTSTPLWRYGPQGPKSLCNACGIRYKKEERRANGSSHRGNNASSTRMDQRNNWPQPESLQYFSPPAGFQLADDEDHRNSEQLTAFRWFGTGGY